MSESNPLETSKAAFFRRIKSAIQAGEIPTFSETELENLWPGPGGRFDIAKAHEDFQRENVHWDWIQPPHAGNHGQK